VTRSRNCAFWPIRPVVRTSNSLLSLAITFLTSGSSARSSSIRGNTIVSRPCCSASSRAARAHSPSRFLVTMARLALVTVSSSRTTTSPALTRSPSRARNSPTTPPVGCWTFFTLDSTTIDPGAISAPEISAVEAQPPSPPASTITIANPIIKCSRIEERAPRGSLPVMIWPVMIWQLRLRIRS
jgi:hypothetical protein